MSHHPSLTPDVAAAIMRDKSLRERLDPQPGISLYLHLSDLRLGLEHGATDKPERILDLGCGGSPYRPLFPNAQYERADLEGMPGIDHIVDPGKPLDVPDGSFDRVLSTQVLEHVEDVHDYLCECRRLLKPGGRLVLTTHGTYPDHGAPWDYQRWTPSGLSRDLIKAGFDIESVHRLTSGPRALIQLWELTMERMPHKGSIFGLLFRVLRGLTRRMRPSLHRWADKYLADYRVPSGDDVPDHRFYVALLIIGKAK